jgi:hypothetical protein
VQSSKWSYSVLPELEHLDRQTDAEVDKILTGTNTMKIGTYIIALATSGVMAYAQNGAAQPGKITITPIIHEVKYCLGPYYPFPVLEQPFGSDITLMVSWKMLYKNLGSEPIILPLRYGSRVRMRILGEENVQTVESREDRYDSNAVRALARPEPTSFIVIPAGASEVGYLGEFAFVRVHALTMQLPLREVIPGIDLLGKTLEFSIVRDHGRLGPPLVEELQAKWKTYGTLWSGTQESETVSVSIPASPATVVCRIGLLI